MERILEQLEPLLDLLFAHSDPKRLVGELIALMKLGDPQALLTAVSPATIANSVFKAAGVLASNGEFASNARDNLLRAEAIVYERLRPRDTWHEVLTVPSHFRSVLPVGTVAETLPTILDLVYSARRSIVLTTPYLDTWFSQLIPSLAASVERGSALLVITRDLSNSQSRNIVAIRELRSRCRSEHLEIVSWEDEGLGLHMKAVVVDARAAYVGSANLTWGGIGQQAELGVQLGGPSVIRLERYLRMLADALRGRRHYQAI